MAPKARRNTPAATQPETAENSRTPAENEDQDEPTLEEQQAAVSARIVQLKELKRLQEEEAALLRQLGGTFPENLARTRRPSHDSNSSSGGDLKIKNIEQLPLHPTIRKRDDWIRDLTRALQLEDAKQRETQAPMDFHIYLDSLEKQFPRATEKQRALSFYAKLQRRLQDHITRHGPSIPETREEIVTLATRYWDSMAISKKRPNENQQPTGQPWKSNRRFQGDSPGNPSRKPDGQKPPFSPANRTPARRSNPDGKPLKCFRCDSTEHLAPDCPNPARAQNAYWKRKGIPCSPFATVRRA